MKTIIFFLINIILLQKYKRVVLKTCEGCALDKYPEIIDFIDFDSESYGDKIEIDYKAGGNPRLICKDENDEDQRVLDISALTRGQIRTVMRKLEFEPKEPLETIRPKRRRNSKKSEFENLSKNIEL